MSGTSCDGVDAALVEIRGRGVELLAFRTFPYPPKLRRAVLDLCRPETARLDDICHLNFVLGEAFADAVIKLAGEAGVPLASIDLILSQHHRFPAARSFYVVGDEGALTLEKDPETGQDGVAIYTPDGVERRAIPSWNPFERELATWIDLCREGKDPLWWQEEGLLTLDLISAYVQAYQCCGVVDVTVQASPEACACCAE